MDPLPEPEAGWSDFRRDRRWMAAFVASVLACAGSLAGQTAFLRWNETRPGTVLEDPVLALFEPVELSIPTFAVIYAALAVGLVVLATRPRRLSIALRAYALTATVRVLLMWLVPLEPPHGILPLIDPLVRAAAGRGLMRDLFFSGHTATLCLLALAMPPGRLRPWFWLGMGVVAVFTVLQHSHYVVDVVVAPPATWVCFRCAVRLEPQQAEAGAGTPAGP